MKVIIYRNYETGGVSMTAPTGELPIEDVLKKDCPEWAMIVDMDALPNADNDFFDAWRLAEDNTVYVDLEVARKIQIDRLNTMARATAQQRALNSAIGLANDPSDEQFLADLNAKRNAINAATSTAELRAVVL